MTSSIIATGTAPVNIAVIKYWGKRDEQRILPINSSLSGTLSTDDLKTITTVYASREFSEDQIWLNGKQENINNPRVQNCLRLIRANAGDHVDSNGNVLVKKDEWNQFKVHIISKNNFPTAAGLASSASGYCCLVYTLAQVYGVTSELSRIARMGSGSACRSMYGGYVKWMMGERDDGEDSYAVPVADEHHWPEMQILVLVANDKEKAVSSKVGMQQSVKTSTLMQKRRELVPGRMKAMEQAIRDRDYASFAELTMTDSDDFHAVCADTDPPIHYLNESSRFVQRLVKAFNEYHDEKKAAYTFDAGPNAVIYILKENVEAFLSLVMHYMPPEETPRSTFYERVNSELLQKAESGIDNIPGALKSKIGDEIMTDGLKYIIHSVVGSGPKRADEEQLNDHNNE